MYPTYSNHTYTQYHNATKINEVINNLAPYLTIDVEQFYTDYFNIDTANDQGLDNWGRILDVQRTYAIPDWAQAFGFDTGEPLSDTTYPQNFDNGNFYDDQSTPYSVDNTLYRLLLKYKYMILTTNCSFAAMNYIMNTLFSAINPTYKVAVTSPVANHIVFTFNFYFTNEQYAIFHDGQFIPLPACCSFEFVQGAIL